MTTTIELKYPIEVNGAPLSSVAMRRLTVGDLEIANTEKTDLGKSIRTVAMSADLAPDDVRKMDAADFTVLSEMVADFL